MHDIVDDLAYVALAESLVDEATSAEVLARVSHGSGFAGGLLTDGLAFAFAFPPS